MAVNSPPRPLTLPQAVRPAPSADRPLSEGYRLRLHRERGRRLRIPMLTAAVSADRLFDAYLEMLAAMGEVVDVVLESSHGSHADGHRDLRRGDIDVPVLASHCYDFEDLLVNDGCTGVAALAPGLPAEVQLDEHKLIVVYAEDLKPFRRVLHRFGVRRVRGLDTLSDGDHLHTTLDRYEDEFEQFAQRLGAGVEAGDVGEWETGSVGE